MVVQRLQEGTPELAPLSIHHTQLKGDTQKCFYCPEAVILMSFGKVLRNALQRLERTTIVFAWFVNRAHDSLITIDECLDVHLRNEINRRDRVVASGVGAEQTSFTFQSLPQ